MADTNYDFSEETGGIVFKLMDEAKSLDQYKRMQAVEDQLVIACNFYESNPEILKSSAGWNWFINSLSDC